MKPHHHPARCSCRRKTVAESPLIHALASAATLLLTLLPSTLRAQSTNEPPPFLRTGPSLTQAPEGANPFVKARWMDRNGDGWDDLWLLISNMAAPKGEDLDKAKDTDGDGVSDYDEMLHWRDPRVKGPPLGWPNSTPEEIAAQQRDAEERKRDAQKQWEATLANKGQGVREQMALGETSTAREKLVAESEFAALRVKAAVSRQAQPAKEKALQDFAERAGAPREIETGNGNKIVLSGGPGGEPLYIGGNNYFAAASISADEVWPTAIYLGRDFTTNYSLTGDGQTVGMWEAGSSTSGGVLIGHQEFGTRIIQKDSAPVGGSTHPTQVAGTLAGTGAIHLFGTGNGALSRGIAYQAAVFANNIVGFKTEREAQAAGNATDPPLLSSNHSYGTIAGWEYEDVDTTTGVNMQWVWRGSTSIGVQEDWRLGTYTAHQDDDTGSFDLDTFMAADAPRHLTVYACGNDRGNGPGIVPESGSYYVPAFGGGYTTMSTSTHPRDWADGDEGGYDSLDAPGTAKNVLTVGACEDVVRVFSASGQPTQYRLGVGSLDPAANGLSPLNYPLPGVLNTIAATFSGCGPTDDGRVKPDLVATGVGNSGFRTSFFLGTPYNLITSSGAATNDYVSTAGTSFSSPGVTGGLTLTLQHRKNLYPALTNADAWRGSTLKAIAIETCDDIGAPGPDFIYGNGIYNVKKSCDLISADKALGRNSLIKEPTLGVNASLSWLVYSLGGQTVSATAAWTDPPRAAPASVVDPTTPMLVNDINLIIEYLGTTASVPDFPSESYPALTTYHPWVVNPDLTGRSAANRGAAATRGVDNRNNVERVSITSAAAGVYRVTLSHAGGLPGNPAPTTQHVSIAMSGVTLRGGRLTQITKAPATDDYSLTFEVDPDAYFTLQSSTDLINWTDVTSVHSSATGNINSIVATAGGSDTRRFWRLKRG